jgi:hypothetical protein
LRTTSGHERDACRRASAASECRSDPAKAASCGIRRSGRFSPRCRLQPACALAARKHRGQNDAVSTVLTAERVFGNGIVALTERAVIRAQPVCHETRANVYPGHFPGGEHYRNTNVIVDLVFVGPPQVSVTEFKPRPGD